MPRRPVIGLAEAIRHVTGLAEVIRHVTGLAEAIRNWLSSAFLLSLASFCISGHFQTPLKLHPPPAHCQASVSADFLEM